MKNILLFLAIVFWFNLPAQNNVPLWAAPVADTVFASDYYALSHNGVYKRVPAYLIPSAIDSTPTNVIADTVRSRQIFLSAISSHSQDSTQLGIDTGGHVIVTGCQCVLHIRDSVSSNQILNSFTSPVTLIAAPGSGYFIKVISINYYYHFISASYVLGTYAGLIEGSTSAYIDNTTNSTNIVESGASATVYSAPGSNGTIQTGSYVNQPVRFYSKQVIQQLEMAI